MIYLQTTCELCFGEAYFEYFESSKYPSFLAMEPEYEAWWRVSEANESRTSYSVEEADIFQYQSYSHSDDMSLMFVIKKNNEYHH
jgi:hypothetical protein